MGSRAIRRGGLLVELETIEQSLAKRREYCKLACHRDLSRRLNILAEEEKRASSVGVANRVAANPCEVSLSSKGTSSRRPSGSSFVLDCANDRREYGAASASGDHL